MRLTQFLACCLISILVGACCALGDLNERAAERMSACERFDCGEG